MRAGTGACWTQREDDRIVELAKEGRSTAVMSLLLGRTAGSIETRIAWLRSTGVEVQRRVRKRGNP